MKIAGHQLEIVGIDANDSGRSCSKHRKCGAILTEGTIIRLALVHFTVGDVEEKAIAAIEVKGGCRVGFARRHLVKHAATYDGAICRVTEVLSKHSTSVTNRQLHYKNKGCAFAVVESFASEAMSNKETEPSMQSDPDINIGPVHKKHDCCKALTPPNKKQKFSELK